MAERRMLTKKVTDDGDFINLSSSAQALYLHLTMCADDDGFTNQIAVSMFKAHASVQDLEALLTNRFLYQFENGVLVITHWRMANALRKDRYTKTKFTDELSRLSLDETGEYGLVANWLPSGCQMVAPSKDKDNKEETHLKVGKEESRRFVPPTPTEVGQYAIEKGLTIDGDKFCDFYESKGWMVGKNKMKDWKAAVRGWCSRDAQTASPKRNAKVQASHGFSTERNGKDDDYNALVWANIRKGWEDDASGET